MDGESTLRSALVCGHDRTRPSLRQIALCAVASAALFLAACGGSSASNQAGAVSRALTPTAAAGASATPIASMGPGATAEAHATGVAPIFAAPSPTATAGAAAASASTPAAGKGRRPVPGNAQQVVQAFKQRGIALGQAVNLTAADDPDHLLGQPGGYTSKAVFVDTRLAGGATQPSVQTGGAVEFFASQRDAERRFTQLMAAQKGSAQPEQLFHDGAVVLRLSHDLKADQVSEYEITARLALAGR